MNKSDQTLRAFTITALWAALICAVTYLIRVPVPIASGAYVNLGDSVIFLAGATLGGPHGAIAAGLGSGLADLLAGATLYIPATVVIKASMGLLTGLLAHKHGFGRFTLAALLGGAVMLTGYFAYEAVLLGAPTALIGAAFNVVQYVGSVVAACALYPALRSATKRIGI